MTKDSSRRNKLRTWSLPLALFVLCLVGFVPMIYRLGFYWDDWPSVWFSHAFGPGGFIKGFSADRPLLAWMFMATTPLMGDSPLRWQLFGVFTRWLSGIALWWTLRGLWPRQRLPLAWIAFLFTLYPGFTQQYIAVTYSNAFLVFCMFLVSLGAMVWAYRKPAWFWPLQSLALVLSALSLFTTEYFFGLELLRPVFLWQITREEEKDTGRNEITQTQGSSRTKRQVFSLVLRRWLPYLVILLAFLVWRVFLDKTPRAKILLFSQLAASPLSTLWELIKTITNDFVEVNLLAWVRMVNPKALMDFNTGVIAMYAMAVLGSALLAGLYLWWLAPRAGTKENLEDVKVDGSLRSETGVTASSQTRLESDERAWRKWALQASGIGLFAFIVAGWPIWVSNLHIELLFPWDRFTLSMMMGVAILLAGLLGLLPLSAPRSCLIGSLVVAMLVGLATGAQFQQRLVYRQEWLAQKNFFWQLTWRLPGLQPGTTLLTSEIPFTYYSDNSLTAPLNWMYTENSSGTRGTDDPNSETPEQNSTGQIPYMLYDIEARLGKGLPSLDPEVKIDEPYRVDRFNGSTSRAVVLFYDPPRCLKVIDPAVDRYLPVKPLYIREAIPLSRLDLVILDPPDPAKALPDIFGPEPSPNWCYYFEKAELYAQKGDWQEVASLADQALKMNRHITEKNIAEFNPFIEGYAHVGKWDKAVKLSLDVYHTWDKMQYALCDLWLRIAQSTAQDTGSKTQAERQAALQQIKDQLQCQLP